MKKNIKIGIIGLGYWGPNLLRNFQSSKHCYVTYVCDKNKKILDNIKKNNPLISTTTNYKELIKNSKVDAVVISTPIKTHYEISLDCIKNGKHIFVEKPLSDSIKKAREIVIKAKRKKLTLFVDHTFIYTDSIIKIKKLLEKKAIGKLLYYDSTRINLGLFQDDANVLWDLAVHDISILLYLMNSMPISVSATGHSHIKNKPENIGFITLKFKNNFVAHINVNWLSPVKIRQTLIGGSKKMIVYNDIEPSEKIKIYDKGITENWERKKLFISYRTGDSVIPHLDNSEALSRASDHFIHCILHNKTPITDGNIGLKVVSIIETAIKSMKKNGVSIKIR